MNSNEVVSMVVMLGVTSESDPLAREDLALALSVVLLGLLMMVSRRNAVRDPLPRCRHPLFVGEDISAAQRSLAAAQHHQKDGDGPCSCHRSVGQSLGQGPR